MKTSEIAAIAKVHPNTVRLYEEWGYISPVQRQHNGYRHYTTIHVQQMLIARLAFKHEFIQNNLRKKATKIVQLSGQQRFKECLQLTQRYFQFLQLELNYAQQAVVTANDLLKNHEQSDIVYTQIACYNARHLQTGQLHGQTRALLHIESLSQ